MPSLEELKFQNQLQQQGHEAVSEGMGLLNKTIQQNNYKQAAAQAADQWQNGDQKGALSTLMQVDPQLAQQVFGGVGKLEAEKDYGQLPTQVADSKAKLVKGPGFKDINLEGPDGSVIKAKMDKGTGQVLDLSGDPISASALSGMKAGFAPTVGVNPNTKEHALYSKGGKTKAIGETGSVIEQNDRGDAVALTAKQNDGITAFAKEFNNDKSTKELVSQINNLNTAKEAIIKNTPGAAMLEKMRLIRGMTPRPAVQEVMALNFGQGWETTAESYIAKASGKGLAPEEQKNFLNMVETFQHANLDEYNQHLHNRVAQTAKNYKVDPSIVVQRVAPNAPTPVQEAMQKVSQLPKEEQAIIDQAHQYLLTHKRTDPDYSDALKVLRMHGL